MVEITMPLQGPVDMWTMADDATNAATGGYIGSSLGYTGGYEDDASVNGYTGYEPLSSTIRLAPVRDETLQTNETLQTRKRATTGNTNNGNTNNGNTNTAPANSSSGCTNKNQEKVGTKCVDKCTQGYNRNSAGVCIKCKDTEDWDTQKKKCVPQGTASEGAADNGGTADNGASTSTAATDASAGTLGSGEVNQNVPEPIPSVEEILNDPVEKAKAACSAASGLPN